MSQSPIYSRSRPSSLPSMIICQLLFINFFFYNLFILLNLIVSFIIAGDLPPLPSTHRATSASAISSKLFFHSLWF